MAEPVPPCSSGARVVVCYDDDQAARDVSTVLRAAGYCVYEAYDCLAAYEMGLTIPDVQVLITVLEPRQTVPRTFYYLLHQNPALSVLAVGHCAQVEKGSIPHLSTLDEPFTAEQLLLAVGARVHLSLNSA